MTNIFSSKSKLSADNDALKASVTELQTKLEQSDALKQELDSIKAQFGNEKTEWNSTVETMKQEFSTAINSLKEEIANITKQKQVVEESAKVEVEKVKEEVKAQVMEGVAAKVASMGLTEAELPKVPQREIAENIRIIRHN